MNEQILAIDDLGEVRKLVVNIRLESRRIKSLLASIKAENKDKLEKVLRKNDKLKNTNNGTT